MGLELKIVSPAKVEYQGMVEKVIVPGISGQFEILQDHAPIISSLSNGEVVYQDSDGEHVLNVIRGFVEVRKNNVDICVEV
ncbi:MAG: F0F1 ATP synthase subunit epsilon [Prevotella sp.]|nr:F0F1 ATP synthase subunit epsilon [Prevotella sp.]MDY5685346.1 F0F1 ATP synthase subunit epsilon [Prevotella sp.]